MANKKLYSIIGNTQRLDGGAMFGNAPKAMWSKWNPPDEENRVLLATRSLLVEYDNALILLEGGMGNFFPPKLKDRYGVIEDENITLISLKKRGFDPQDITHVILSHLHFDHMGGILTPYYLPQNASDPQYEIVYPNAKIFIGLEHWNRALSPHPRDRASFIPSALELLSKRKDVYFISPSENNITKHPMLPNDFSFEFSHGHTPGLLITSIDVENGQKIYFTTDLIPGASWVHTPISMGYDRFAELVIDEKKVLLEKIVKENSFVYFYHDPNICMAQISCVNNVFKAINAVATLD